MASSVSVLLLARVDETSSEYGDTPTMESLSELEDDDGLPGRSDIDDMDRS